jgi:hypothetical protein
VILAGIEANVTEVSFSPTGDWGILACQCLSHLFLFFLCRVPKSSNGSKGRVKRVQGRFLCCPNGSKCGKKMVKEESPQRPKTGKTGSRGFPKRPKKVKKGLKVFPKRLKISLERVNRV